MSRNTRLATAVLTTMLGGAALAFASQPGGTAAEGSGVYRGYLDTRSPRGPVQVTLRVDSLASDDELAAVEAVLADRGQEAMFAALDRMKVNGWFNFNHDMGYPVTVLGEQRTATGRRVVALINRPLRFNELAFGTRSALYPFSLVVLDVDASGSGQGSFVPAAQARVDTQGHISFDDYARIPYRIMRVREDGASGS